MREVIAGLRAAVELVEIEASAEFSEPPRQPEEKPAVRGLPAHQFPAREAQAHGKTEESESAAAMPALPPADEEQTAVAAAPGVSSFESRLEQEDRDRARRIYRGRTVAMLRRYLRYSIEAGRLPSLLGSEFFRAKVTAYTVVTFEDRVIFVHDMETCLDRLDGFSRQIIARHILQEHDQAATGRLLGCTERTVRTYVPVVLDLFSEILLEVGLMERLDSIAKNSCQGGENDQIAASDCEEGKYKF
jgi:hypothetical protein